MSKGIDYSKFDHIGDSDDEEEETAKQETKGKGIFRGTSNKESQQGEEGLQGEKKTSKAAKQFDLQQLCNLLQGGNVNYLSTHDILSAALLLSSVTPGGVQDRATAAQKKQKVNTKVDELREDPVLQGLWNLTMKIRSGVEHAEEILKVHGIDRLLSIMKDCNLAKYNKDHPEHVPIIASSNTGEQMSEAQLKQAVCLRRDVFDLVMVIAALHELCRYRSGCVALANHDECLVFLWNLPFDHVVASVMETMNAHNFSTVGPIDWGNPYNYSVGMVEQGIIDTFGRLLNGLDEHPSLRHKVAAMMMHNRNVDALEARMQFTLSVLSKADLLVCPDLNHRVDIPSSLSRLRQLLSHCIDDDDKSKHHVKAWRSTFRFDRQFVAKRDGRSVHSPGGGNKDVNQSSAAQTCSACAKTLETAKVCARCRAVFYCSRECQVKDWKIHKRSCVKHRGFVPSGTDWQTEHTKSVLGKLQAEIAKQETKK